MPTRQEPTHRLRAQDIIDRQAETIRMLTERHTSGPPSVAVELTRNAKWDVQLSVKVTANTDTTPAELARHAMAVLKVATDTYDKAARKYGTPAPALVPPVKTTRGGASGR